MKLSNIVNYPLGLLGYTLIKKPKRNLNYPEDLGNDTAFIKIYEEVKDQTMTSIERCYALYQAVQYVLKNNIKGDFVECGVWRGGSSMLIAKTLAAHNVRDRKLYMYDTFEGMSKPTEEDGKKAFSEWKEHKVTDDLNSWCLSTLDEVKANMQRTNYPKENITLVKGKVEDTIPGTLPKQIALLRLDTDWYESTKHELIHLFPLLENKGIMIIDDYGHWEGARKAVDEYFAGKNDFFLNRIDYTGRLWIKS